MAMYTPYFNETHQQVRLTVRKFVDQHIRPFINDWEEAGTFPRELYLKAGEAGLLGIDHPEELGGSGPDVFMKIAASEELMRAGSGGLVASLGSLDIGLPPVENWGSAEMKQRIAPAVIRGEKIMALAITEPSGGSDVANLKGDGSPEVWHMALEFFARAPKDAVTPLIEAMDRAMPDQSGGDVVKTCVDAMGSLDDERFDDALRRALEHSK